MSLPLIESEVLKNLAERGEAGAGRVHAQLREVLGKTPGRWLPEGYDAGYQLVERALRRANELGANVLLRELARLLSVLFAKLLREPLDQAESRQLLGALKVGATEKGLPDHRFEDALRVALESEDRFWDRVQPADEITGPTETDRHRFIEVLCEALPKKKVPAPPAEKPPAFASVVEVKALIEGETKYFTLQSPVPGSPVFFAWGRAKPGIVVSQMELAHEFWQCATPDVLKNAALTQLYTGAVLAGAGRD